MKYFNRAIRDAWRHWPILVAGIFCSFVAALLWGVNIIAVWPVLQTTVQGENLHSWNQHRIEATQVRITAIENELTALTATGNLEERSQQLKQDLLKTNLKVEQGNLRMSQWMAPWFETLFPKDPFATVFLVLVLVVVGTLVKQLFSLANTVLISYVAQCLAREFRMKIFHKAISLDRAAFNRAGGISSFMANITQTTDNLSQGVTAFYGGLVAEPLRIICCLALAMMVSWRITLASMISVPLMAMTMIWLNRRIRGLARIAMDRSLSFYHVILEVLSALVTVQANTMEDFEQERFRQSTKQMRRMGVLASFYLALANPLTEIFGITALCTGLGAASYLVINQQTHIFGIQMATQPMTAPELAAVFALLVGATDPLRKLSGVVNGINSGTAAADFLYPILDAQSSINDPVTPKTISRPHGKIEFRDITFAYDQINPVLRNVNLSINFGDRLAIVGPNGGGKSTLVNLLCRFYEPQDGHVLIDNVSVKEMALSDLRSRISIVSQQPDFFNESILYNIRYGRWDATEAEVIEVAKKAKAHDFISEFPDGYRTMVGPAGQRLSGGQRQRIALARALLRDADIVILDEATNQIDVESEKLIHEILLNYVQDRTLIIITHSQSSLYLANRIVEIERGVVTEVTSANLKAA